MIKKLLVSLLSLTFFASASLGANATFESDDSQLNKELASLEK